MDLYIVEVREWFTKSCELCQHLSRYRRSDIAYIASTQKAVEFCKSNPNYSFRNKPWYWVICKETIDGINEQGKLDSDGAMITCFDWDGNEWYLSQPSFNADIFKDCHKWKHPLWRVE